MREGSGVPLGGPVGVGWPTQRSVRGQDAYPEFREGSRGPCRGLEGPSGGPGGHMEVPKGVAWMGLGGPPEDLRVVGRPIRRSGKGSGRLPSGLDGVSRPTRWSGGSGSPPEGPGNLSISAGGVGRTSSWAGRCRESLPGGLGGFRRPTWRSRRPTRRSGRGWEDHLEVQKAHPVAREGLEGPPGGPRRVGRPCWKSGRGQEAFQVGREVSGGPPGGSGVSLVGQGGVGRPTRRSRRGRDIHSEVQEGSEGTLGVPGGDGRPTQ